LQPFLDFFLGGILSFVSASRQRLLNRQLSQVLENAQQEEIKLREQIRELKVAAADQPQTQSQI
jgi:hypothetical protein